MFVLPQEGWRAVRSRGVGILVNYLHRERIPLFVFRPTSICFSSPLGISHSHTIPRLGPIRSSLYTPYPSNKATIGRLPLPEVTVSHADKAVRFLAAGSSRPGRTIVKVASALFQYPLLPFGSVFCRSRAGDIFRNRQSRVKHAVIISWLCLAPPRHATPVSVLATSLDAAPPTLARRCR